MTPINDYDYAALQVSHAESKTVQRIENHFDKLWDQNQEVGIWFANFKAKDTGEKKAIFNEGWL